MNRYELLKELYGATTHNLYCYSEDYLMSRAKVGCEEQWHKEKEKLELIEELIEEEKSQKFHLYTSIYNLSNDREGRVNHELAYLEDRENCISCCLNLVERADEKNIPEYELVFNLHKKGDFDNEYESIYSRDIKKDAFINREALKNEMKKGLEEFKEFIAIDKSKKKFFEKYYETDETEEFE